MRFSEFYGVKSAKLSLVLLAIEPGLKGVLLVGGRGTGKSSLARAFKNVVPDAPFVELPVGVTEDAVCGGVDVERTLKEGERIYQPGILCRADGGFVFIDDIHLINPEILSHVFEVQERGVELVEREGLSVSNTTSFAIVATFNPDEGDISEHFLDRFGLSAYTGFLSEARRKRVIKYELKEGSSRGWDAVLKARISKAKGALSRVKVSDEVFEYISQLSLAYGARSHRSDVFLLMASRAYAAFRGEAEVKRFHVDKVKELVLAHRINPPLHDEDEQNEGKDSGGKGSNSKGVGGVAGEKVFEIGSVYPVRRFLFKKDRLGRKKAGGRRSSTRYLSKGGRYVKAVFRDTGEVALDATIRAASCFQKARGRKERLIITDEDIRYREKEKKMGHLFIFIVDSSGSMGVERRMVEVKGAVISLISQCYKMRDKVSLIVFRKDRGEVVLPPTKSLDLAWKLLKDLPTGGRTPLGSGLLKGYEVARKVLLKYPGTKVTFVILTDGRANKSISSLPPFEEAERVLLLMRELRASFIVVDTQKSNILRSSFPLKMARILSAPYFRLEDVKAETLVSIVKREVGI